MPTSRAVLPSLFAIGAITAAGILAAVLSGLRGVVIPTEHVELMAAGLAVAVAAPNDPGARLLAPLPVGEIRRLAHRTAITGIVGAIAWLIAGSVFAGSVFAGSVSSAPGVTSMLALAGVAVVGHRRFGAWGACAPLAVVAVRPIVDPPAVIDEVLHLWVTHPWAVLTAAMVVGAAAPATIRR